MNLKRHFSPPQYFHYFDSELFDYPLSLLGQMVQFGASKSNFRGIYPLNDAVTRTHATSFRSYEYKPPLTSFPKSYQFTSLFNFSFISLLLVEWLLRPNGVVSFLPSEICRSPSCMESPASSSEAPVVSSCRRKKNFGSGSFVSDLRAHIHEFLHASVDEHRICLVDTFKKVSF